MNTNTSAERRIAMFPVRLGMFCVLLPIVLALILFFAIMQVYTYDHNTEIFGLTAPTWRIFTCLAMPLLMSGLVLLKGWWRPALITMLTVPLISLVFSNMLYVKPENRLIEFGAIADSLPYGTEVICNDVSLGKVPFGISVSEFESKVSRWTSPPDQSSLGAGEYSWFPWDEFVSERYEQRFDIDKSRSENGFDSRTQYWWRFDYNGNRGNFFAEDGYTAISGRFDEIYGYYFNNLGTAFFPANRILYRLLVDELADNDYRPSPEWVAYAEKCHPAILERLFKEMKDNPKLEPAGKAIARLRYGLSEKPGEAECENAIRKMVETADYNGFAYGNIGSNSYDTFFEQVRYVKDPVLKTAIRELGPACEKPLKRLYANIAFRTKRSVTSELANSIMAEIAGTYRFPSTFNDIVQVYSTERWGFYAMMNYEDERAAALLKSLFERRENPLFFMASKSMLSTEAYSKILGVCDIDNPVLEPIILDYCAEWLPEMQEYNVQNILPYFIHMRSRCKNFDPGALSSWVASLRINVKHKRLALAYLKWLDTKDRSLGLMLFPLNENIAEKISEASLKEWIEKNPEGKIEDYLSEMTNLENGFAKTLATGLFQGLIDRNKPEAEGIIKHFWSDPDSRSIIVFVATTSVRGPKPFPSDSYLQQQAEMIAAQNIDMADSRLPRRISLNDNSTAAHYSIRSSSFDTIDETDRLPGYFITILGSEPDVRACEESLPLIARIRTEESKRLIQKWSESDNAGLKKKSLQVLEKLERSEKMRAERKILFEKLLSGKITPDSLLEKSGTWKWNGEKYVY